MVALLASTSLGTAALAAGNTDTTATEGTEAANTAADPAVEDSGAAEATQSAAEDNSKPTDDMMNRADSDGVYRSMRQEADTFEGTITNDLSVEDLMDRDVVDVAGEHIGEVDDLLIGPDDTVTQAIVDVGGFLGIGEKTVAIDLNELQIEQGAGGALMVDITREQAEALPEYEEDDAGWRMM